MACHLFYPILAQKQGPVRYTVCTSIPVNTCKYGVIRVLVNRYYIQVDAYTGTYEHRCRLLSNSLRYILELITVQVSQFVRYAVPPQCTENTVTLLWNKNKYQQYTCGINILRVVNLSYKYSTKGYGAPTVRPCMYLLGTEYLSTGKVHSILSPPP